MRELRGKGALVTGGASGIGLAMARAFAREGMKVALADIEAAALERAAEEIRQYQAEVTTHRLDVAQREAMAEAVAEAEAAFGGLHLLCNNAGVGAGGPIQHVTPGDWDWGLGVNLHGVVNGLIAGLPALRRHGQGGHVVNTASIAGLLAPGGMGVYCAAKFAVVAISESMKQDLAPEGIGVSVLCPGFVQTQIHESRRNRDDRFGAVTEPPDGELRRAMVTHAIQTGMSPDHVAARVVRAVKNDEFYIVTHPEFRAQVEGRHRLLMQAFDVADETVPEGHRPFVIPGVAQG